METMSLFVIVTVCCYLNILLTVCVGITRTNSLVVTVNISILFTVGWPNPVFACLWLLCYQMCLMFDVPANSAYCCFSLQLRLSQNKQTKQRNTNTTVGFSSGFVSKKQLHVTNKHCIHRGFQQNCEIRFVHNNSSDSNTQESKQFFWSIPLRTMVLGQTSEVGAGSLRMSCHYSGSLLVTLKIMSNVIFVFFLIMLCFLSCSSFFGVLLHFVFLFRFLYFFFILFEPKLTLGLKT